MSEETVKAFDKFIFSLGKEGEVLDDDLSKDNNGKSIIVSRKVKIDQKKLNDS